MQECTQLEDLQRTILSVGDGVDPMDAAAAFLRRYEGAKVHIVSPQLRKAQIAALSRDGLTTHEIAREVGLTERYIRKVVFSS